MREQRRINIPYKYQLTHGERGVLATQQKASGRLLVTAGSNWDQQSPNVEATTVLDGSQNLLIFMWMVCVFRALLGGRMGCARFS